MTRIPLTVTFSSDWHIGQGAGRPKDLDDMVRRDSDGYPHIPAKTLGQMWRDAGERVATGLDGSAHGPWSMLVVALFGSQPADSQPSETPVPARIFPEPCRYSDAVKARLAADALTFPKTAVAIDPATQAARHDHLRTVEMARTGSVLHGFVDVEIDDWDNGAKAAALALLRAGLEELTRLGGKRRRGAGRVEVIAQSVFPDLSDALETLSEDPPAIPATPPVTVTAPLAMSTPNGIWWEADLTVELSLPIVIPDRTAGNVVSTRDFIPGTFLLGPVVGALDGGWKAWLATVQAGGLRILNAHREVAGARGLPVPFCLFYEKGTSGLANGGAVWNRLRGDPPVGTQAVQHRHGYLAGDAAATTLQQVSTGTHTHGTIDDRVQRPTEAVGGVYTYQAIEPGPTFRSTILLRTENRPTGGFEVATRLGTSKKDDYGTATVRCSEFRKVDHREETTVSETTLWLISDLLMRSPANQPSGSLNDLARVLDSELGVEVTIEPAFLRTRRTDGWVGRWDLPRPTLVGLAAGSAMKLNFKSNVSLSALRDLEVRGLGERVAEGFGEVRFGALLLEDKEPRGNPVEGPSAEGDQDAGEVDSDSVAFVSAVLAEQGRRRLARAAAITAASDRTTSLGWTKTKPSNTQLGALRSALRSEETLRAWWEGVKAVPNRRNAWPKKAQRTLEGLIDEPQRVIEILGIVSDRSPWDALRLYLHAAVSHELRARRGQATRDENDG